jgi:TonB family protein
MPLGPRPRTTIELTATAAALLLGMAAAHAQTPAANTGLERAQKAADAVFHWIKINGEKGANRQPAAPAPAPAARKPAPVATAPKPAPAPATRNVPAPAEAAAPVAAVTAPAPEARQDNAPVLLAAATPTPTPDAPLALAATAVQPPPAPPVVEEEVPLKLLSRVNPAIPRQLQQQNFRDGYARVKFTVAPDGSVSKAETIKASHSRLGVAAVDAVKQWRFAPIPEAREAGIEFAFNTQDE